MRKTEDTIFWEPQISKVKVVGNVEDFLDTISMYLFQTNVFIILLRKYFPGTVPNWEGNYQTTLEICGNYCLFHMPSKRLQMTPTLNGNNGLTL